jgi:PelA/Pel-15E family pectate lyase
MIRSLKILFVLTLSLPGLGRLALAQRQEAEQALRRAGAFFRNQVASGGGYVYLYSSDLKYRQGEGVAGPQTIWIQPPGTPAVGEAFLDAYDATGDRFYLDAAHETGQALVKGQLQSGGWNYRVELDPSRRNEFRYRVDRTSERRPPKDDPDEAMGGWDVWKKRKHKDNITVVDDDTTPAAVRFLCRLDKALGRQDRAINDAALYALDSLLNAQHPIGAWSHNYDRYPTRSPDPAYYPMVQASYPDNWSRTWTKDFTGGYSINDRVTLNMIKTMLFAAELYNDNRYRASAERGGTFLIWAQMPDPQPAWAQQYDRQMHPVWDRSFEPPAITGLESQDALETLLLLHRKTGDAKYLAPIARALDYLKQSRLPDGRIARFYELKTNRPLYFTRDYEITYDGSHVPTHYGFVFDSRLDAIEAAYLRQKSGARVRDDEPPRLTPELSTRVRTIIASLDARGAWTEPGSVRDPEGRKVTPASGVISSATFSANMRVLAQFLMSSRR